MIFSCLDVSMKIEWALNDSCFKNFYLSNMRNKLNWNFLSPRPYVWRRLPFMTLNSQVKGSFLCLIMIISLCCLKLTPSMIMDTKTKAGSEWRETGIKYMVHLSEHGMIVCNTCVLTRIVEVILEWRINLYAYSNYIPIIINSFCWNVVKKRHVLMIGMRKPLALPWLMICRRRLFSR